MLRRLYTLIEGYLQLKITGIGVEKLINQLIRNEFKLWNLIRIDDVLYVNIKLKDFKKIRKYVKRSDCKVEIQQKKGLPFLLNRIINRRALVIGIIILIISLYTISSFLLFIEVKGTKKVEKKEIIKFLNKVQVHPGVLKSSIPLDKLEKILIKNNSQISWANLYFKGTKLIVEVVEKKMVKTKINPSDIVAEKPGVITKLIVLKGTPVVEEGMTVKAGQLLIDREVVLNQTRDVINNEEDDKNIPIEKKYVKAEGIIKAKVWYEGYGEAKLTKHYYQVTKNIKKNIIIRYNDKELIIKGPKKPPYSKFKIEERVKYLPKWRNIDLPIELITRRYIQLKEFTASRKVDVAKKLAKKKAIESVLHQLSKEAIILNSKIKWLKANEEKEDIIRVKSLIEVEEDIGIRRE